MQIISEQLKKDLLHSIRDIPDYPKPGIVFKDITTLVNNAPLLTKLIESLKQYYDNMNLDFVAGIEARGFIFGAMLAYALNVGFVPIRKKGKLPFTTMSEKYSLEYGFDEVEIHIDAFREKQNARVLLIDDLIATGGTAQAAFKLIESLGAKCIEACFILNLPDLQGAQKLSKSLKVTTILDIGN
ncbi:adenine phosphoribosyltransferase [Helicobacter cappadocius]|uniref:Adenine phosphoribosyltransferase n=1 Tax=Helicobacter cappadocius TaxID=3063998 RepID=A0AA90PWX7_9HELI|nr:MULTISPECIES: adenine phosphoribosyltransferase [unclassified Helicobacter]MDO7253737.1 adenine phosphoribosyltransferase [Helicobacter sp. faydin-H75]MDP2539665.1 adenine phosphoribosyltransferase [Helicobacter sp. faydin-H76]